MIIEKDKRYLMLVESPEKATTIKGIFDKAGIKNVFVMATYGHFTKIKDGSGYKNTGINPADNFKADYVIDSTRPIGKVLTVGKNVQRLKEQVKMADIVIIASDPDREGEAIAWSCVKFLNIPKSKYKRVTYHSINQAAIFKGIEQASDLNNNLVDSAHARQNIDKLLGFGLSEDIRNHNKGKSGGRVQSALLRLICDRELEIINFKPEKYIDLYLHFIKNNVEFKAKYQGTDNEEVDKITEQSQIDSIFEDCSGNPFYIKSIDKRNKRENPKVPFCTATFQQECFNKLGLKVKEAQDLAQKLFDSGLISYHRTDSEIFEAEFEDELKSFVKAHFDKKYISGTITKGKVDATEQGGHEALHVLDLNLTPEEFAKETSSPMLVKVYRIIYNRTIACALAPAIIAETKYNIANGKHNFAMTSNELVFEGYRCVYSYRDTDDKSDTDGVVKESFVEGEVLNDCSFESIPKETKPKARYKESSMVKVMKDEGLGRPSTYSTTIETIKSADRGYVEVVDGCLKPTERGMNLDAYLRENHPNLINVPYTSEMEKDLDLIANGKLNYLDFLNSFYTQLDESLKRTSGDDGTPIDKACPECGKPLVKRKGKYGYFLGCSGFPKCKHIEKL